MLGAEAAGLRRGIPLARAVHRLSARARLATRMLAYSLNVAAYALGIVTFPILYFLLQSY